MKYAIILPDGAADEPLEQLNGLTPLGAARTPNLDWIASHGQIGTVRTVPNGMSPGSDVATLSVIAAIRARRSPTIPTAMATALATRVIRIR